MVMKIYERAFKVLLKKPLKLWGISLLFSVLTGVLVSLCGVAIPVLGIAVTLLMGTSMLMIFLNGYRGEDVKVVDLFSCFKDWATIKRVVLGLAWMALWIFLWSLIPVVGFIFAIVRAYEYRLTPYILVMEPDISITEAIQVSKQRTEGFKLQMFLADIALGVALFVVALVLGLFSAIPYLGILFALALIVVLVAVALFGNLFMGLVQAAFYEEINKEGAFCAGCGARLDEGARFCATCGKAVE